MKKQLINAMLFMAMDSRFYITTSGRVDNVAENTVTPFLDSADNEIMKLKHENGSVSDVASKGIQNRVFANEAAAVAAGLTSGQFYVTLVAGNLNVRIVA